MATLIADKYEAHKAEVNERFEQLRANEEELNRIFARIYHMEGEVPVEVEDKYVSVQRIFDTAEEIPESYKGNKYVRTRRDEIVSLISYAVGCMYGKVQQLPQLVQTVRQVHAALLQRARQEMDSRVAEAFGLVAAKASEEGVESQVSAGIKGQREALEAKIDACDLIADVTVLGNEVDAGASRAYLAVTEAVKREQAVERARERAAQHPKAGGAEPAARANPVSAFGTGVPTAAEPALNVARVSRVAVLPPEVLTTAAEVDAYVERLRRALMQGLADHDAVQLR